MGNDPKNRDKVDQLRPHNFDGIQEYDNALPRWWLWLFILTVIFTPIYLAYFHFGKGKSISQELQEDLAQVQGSLKALPTNATPLDYVAMGKDPAVMKIAQEAFAVNCVACHAATGGGTIGPNLTDKFWIHGSSAEAIHNTIAQGVTDKGMPAWLQVLGVEKVNALTAYILTLKNTNVAGGKAPQGEEEKPAAAIKSAPVQEEQPEQKSEQ